jgi:glycosyltransferase involved in cell wall biosynthesis
MLLSVIIPVYNERHTLGPILRVVARTLPDVRKEIIVDDDRSKNHTRETSASAHLHHVLPRLSVPLW